MAISRPVTFELWFQSQYPAIKLNGALSVVRLASEGATVPFIARYRKEQTGNLDEVAIRNVLDAKEEWDWLVNRQAYIIKEIEKQNKLTPELKAKVESSFDRTQLEDMFLPYRIKKKSKATAAKEAGLLPLADWIWNCGHGTQKPEEGQTLEVWALTFKNDEKGITDAATAIQGATDILIERLSEDAELRQKVRTYFFEKGQVKTEKGEGAKPNSKFEKYFTHHEPVKTLLMPQNVHRYSAMRRGWHEKELTLAITGAPNEDTYDATLTGYFESASCTERGTPFSEILLRAAQIAYKAHVLPSIENEVHRALREVAEGIAVKVFAENVRTLLMASPFGPKAVVGVDPGIRTGCKLAVVDASGKFLGSAVVQIQTDEEKELTRKGLVELFKDSVIQAIAIGNGTGGREFEIFIRKVFKENNITTPVVMVSEAGASVYSASEAGREEFPDLDVTIRGAISIARRTQDPLAELVKIDPKSIGVGQYQHDVRPNVLKKGLDAVVDSCVNSVGVNLNTASYHLLANVSGIGPALAKSIVSHRGEKGLFKSREQLMEVPSFNTKAFEQAAGFLRIHGGTNPLDNTGVHPERYAALEQLATRLGKSVKDLTGEGVAVVKQDAQFKQEVGDFTFNDIVTELEKPGRDPRDAFTPFAFRDDIFELKDLKQAMVCPGIVTNVTNFGAFVDIGVHQDGLVHLSQLSDKFVKDPHEIVKPGQRVNVKVLDVNLEKHQIALSMKALIERPKPEPRPRPQHAQGQGQHRGGRDNRPQQPRRPPRPVFRNDAFAVLATLKNQLKK